MKRIFVTLSVLLSLGRSAHAQTVVPVKNGANTVFVGDSLTALAYYNQGLAQGLNSQLKNFYATYTTTTTGARAKSTGSVSRTSGGGTALAFLNITNSGVPGNTTTDIAAAVPARITAFNPDIIVMLIGINDIHTGVPIGTIQTNVQSIFSQVRSWSATVPIVWISCMFSGELWVTGPPPAFQTTAPQNDSPAVDAVNAMEAAQCTADAHCIYVDVRSVAAAYESLNNLPQPGASSGILTSDGTHWNIAGQTLASSTLLPYFTVVYK